MRLRADFAFKDPKKREQLLDILESRSKSPVPLSQIVNVLDKFSYLQKKLESELTEEDITLVKFTIKYFENWFYRGEWTHIPDRSKKNQDITPYAYFSVPAGIINMGISLTFILPVVRRVVGCGAVPEVVTSIG